MHLQLYLDAGFHTLPLLNKALALSRVVVSKVRTPAETMPVWSIWLRYESDADIKVHPWVPHVLQIVGQYLQHLCDGRRLCVDTECKRHTATPHIADPSQGRGCIQGVQWLPSIRLRPSHCL